MCMCTTNILYIYFFFSDLWMKRAEAETNSPESDSAVEISPSPQEDYDDCSPIDPQLVPFSVGRVYYTGLCRQVHVFPTPASSDVEVTMIGAASRHRL